MIAVLYFQNKKDSFKQAYVPQLTTEQSNLKEKKMCIAKCKQDVLSVLWITFIAFHVHGSASHLLRENQYSIRNILILLPFLWASLVAQTVKNWPVTREPPGSIPGSERAPGEGNGNPLQYSCLENLMDRGIWWVTVHGVAKESDTTEQLTHTHTHTHTHTIVWSSQVVQCRRLPVNAEDSKNAGLIPGLGRFPREGNGNPFQYSCLENPMDRGTWWATVHGVAKESDKTEWLTLYRLPIPISFLWQACEVKEREVIFHISPRTINPESETANCPSIHHVTLFLFLEPHFEGEIQEHYLVSSVQSISRVWFFVTPWTAARQASLSITNSRSSPKLLSIKSVMPSSHLILCRPLPVDLPDPGI